MGAFVLVIAILAGTRIYEFLLFHVIVEMFSVIVAACIFAIAWNTRHLLKNQFIVFLGISFFAIGLTDFAHTLTFSGMNLIADTTADTAVQLWILARFFQAAAFLLAPFFINHRLPVRWLVLAWFVPTIWGIADIFAKGWFPVCFVADLGLTPFKKAAELVIIVMLAGAAWHLTRHRKKIDPLFFLNFMAAIFLSILSEAAFTGYVAFTDVINWIGHTFKVLAFFLLYAAIVRNGLQRPVEVLTYDSFTKTKELDRSEATLRRAQSVAKTGSWRLNLQTNLIEWSEETYRLFGLANGSPVSYETILSHTHPEDRALLRNSWRQAVKDETSFSLEHRVVRSDGSILWLRATAELLGDQNGHAIEAVGTVQDITLQKETEAALIAAKQMADQASKAKSEFLSNMSHELRTPLNVILGFAQLVGSAKDSPLGARQSEHVQYIMDGGQHLLNLINEILDLAKIEAGKLKLSLEATSARELIDESLAFCQPFAEKYEIRLNDLSEQDLPLILIDHTRGRQILLNLISNAIKYNRKGGLASIKAEEKSGRLRITVIDTGYGIPTHKQIELFKPFSRLGAEASSIEGTGIGLALTRHLVENMNGEIGFESEVDVGSRFWVEFPLAKKGESAGALNSTAPAYKTSEFAFDKKSRLMLYIEDNQTNLRLIEETIKEIVGLTLISATDAESGIILAETHQPDVILLDINLPGMSGIEALEELKRNPVTRHIPVIALSADATKGTIERGRAAGFFEYLVKPVVIPELIQTLHRAIEGEI
jgi:PAS domain S-box-containing protein